ncbi:zincin [Lichtheimia hyalospora FSU 10163]|nr:zincin [Lichtheimia hyalospora FSU 10163]
MSLTPNTNGCPSTRRIAYMGVVADCTYVQSYGSIRLARLQILNNWNIASAVYERTFNVSLGLIYIQMSTADCPRHPSASAAWNQKCSSFYTINDRLSDFSLWRGKRGDDGAALWHLMTKCSTGVKVGIAWLSQLCETQVSQQIEENGASEWVSGTGVSSITRDEWKVVAHEVGHGFGAIHDCTAQTCPCTSSGCSCCPLSDDTCSAGDTYLMNPTSNVTSEDFSPCSISDICGSFPNIGYCLKSPDLRDTTSFTLCGNGILEPGEECDSGLTDSACCHAKNCTLKPGAKCDDYSQQCCLNCTMATAETVCRPAVSECDIAEYCTGDSFSCPADQVEENGSPCGNNTMQCASGVCTSRDEQCIARGMRLGVTQDCSFQHDSCQISCADPSDPGNCLVLSGVFLDGTECGLASFCEKGQCVSTGALNTLKAWVAQNKQIAIPVFLFGSLIILALLGWLAWFLVRRHRRNRLATAKDKDSRPPSTAHSVVIFGDDNRARRRHSHTGSSFHEHEQPRSLFQSSTTMHDNARNANENNTPTIFTSSSPTHETWELQPIPSDKAISPLADRSTLYQPGNPYPAVKVGDSPIAMNTTAAEFSRVGGYTDTSYYDNPDSVAVALGGGGSGHRHRRVKSTTT